MAASWSPAPGTFGSVNVQSGGGGALTGGHFGEITQIDGSPCAALLAEGYAYSDGGIINGYVPIVGGVDVVPHAQHQYVWLNQKLLCGCGHVADEDADAPVITGITDGETYYDDVTFTVTDAHDFTVTVDGQPATAEGSLYTLPADNVSHEIVAVDVAGNRTTVTVSVYRTYTVTPAHRHRLHLHRRDHRPPRGRITGSGWISPPATPSCRITPCWSTARPPAAWAMWTSTSA